jgi:HEAT repeat protein
MRLRSSVLVATLLSALLGCGAARLLTAAQPAAQDAVQMTIDLLGRDDAEFRQIALDRVRTAVRGEAATQRFAALLPTLSPARQAELLAALADRGDRAAAPAMLALLSSSQDEPARAAAIRGLAAVGAAAEVPILVKSLAAGESEKAAARRGLVVIAADAGPAILAATKAAAPGLKAALLEVLAERRERPALPEFAVAAVDDDAAVRAAAMRSLAALGGPDQVEAMVRGVLKAAAGGERDQAERALVTVCTQNPGRERAADAFLARFQSADDADKEVLVAALGRIGGERALTIVDGLIAGPDAAARKLGLAALTRWPDATVAPRLLDLLAKAQDPAEREQLLSTLIRIAPLPDNKLNDRQKLDLLQKTMTLCQREADRRRVLERANAIRTIDTLRFVVPYLDDSTLAEPACLSVVELAHHRNLRDANKDEFTKALDKVIATTKNAELVERAQRYKQGQTWERKKPPAKS